MWLDGVAKYAHHCAERRISAELWIRAECHRPIGEGATRDFTIDQHIDARMTPIAQDPLHRHFQRIRLPLDHLKIAIASCDEQPSDLLLLIRTTRALEHVSDKLFGLQHCSSTKINNLTHDRFSRACMVHPGGLGLGAPAPRLSQYFRSISNCWVSAPRGNVLRWLSVHSGDVSTQTVKVPFVKNGAECPLFK